MKEEHRGHVHGYQCVDCDRVFFAVEKSLPKNCPFCTCPSVVRVKGEFEVVIKEDTGEK